MRSLWEPRHDHFSHCSLFGTLSGCAQRLPFQGLPLGSSPARADPRVITRPFATCAHLKAPVEPHQNAEAWAWRRSMVSRTPRSFCVRHVRLRSMIADYWMDLFAPLSLWCALALISSGARSHAVPLTVWLREHCFENAKSCRLRRPSHPIMHSNGRMCCADGSCHQYLRTGHCW